MSKSENFDLKLHFQLAFCILQVAFFKICHWRKKTFPNVFTKSICNCDMSVARPHVMLFCIGSLCLFAICRGCNSYWCSDEGGRH